MVLNLSLVFDRFYLIPLQADDLQVTFVPNCINSTLKFFFSFQDVALKKMRDL